MTGSAGRIAGTAGAWPIETVQEMYAAFGRGDVPAILRHLHPDVEWEPGAADHGVPWLQPRSGRAEVPSFFATLIDMEFHRFEPQTPMANEHEVAVPVYYDMTWKPTGKRLADLEIHLWTFDAEGRVVKFRHFMDTEACCDAVRA